jgi:hypothetical protein
MYVGVPVGSRYGTFKPIFEMFQMKESSVGNPDPEPDPHVFGTPGSGSICQRCGSGSGSFPFLINVLSGLKKCLQNKILTQCFSTKLNFLD